MGFPVACCGAKELAKRQVIIVHTLILNNVYIHSTMRIANIRLTLDLYSIDKFVFF